MDSEIISELLSVLEIVSDVSDVTLSDIKKAFRRLALLLHPDKSGDDDAAEKTAKFQKLRSAYEKLNTYFSESPNPSDNPETVDENVEDDFMKDNFDKFNFPYENSGSFTVKIEEYLADTWQEHITVMLGKPKVKINDQGTECDRHWKVHYAGIDITLHIYNKPKNKKGSKLMLQGSRQSVLCAYVFTELPKIYKLVCANKPNKLQINNGSGRKIGKPLVKCEKCKYKSTLIQMKMHMKTVHGNRPTRASKRLPNFTPVIKVAKRTKSDLGVLNCEGIGDDSSILLIDDTFSGRDAPTEKDEITLSELDKVVSEQYTFENTGSNGQIPQPKVPIFHVPNEGENDVLMETEDRSFDRCEFECNDQTMLNEHIVLTHDNRISDTDVEKMGGKVLTEFFCSLCDFITDNKEDLDSHSKLAHNTNETKTEDLGVHSTSEDFSSDTQVHPSSLSNENLLVADEVEVKSLMFTCGDCEFSTENKGTLTNHIDVNHKPNQSSSEESLSQHIVDKVNVTDDEEDLKFACKKCENHFDSQTSLSEHIEGKHLIIKIYKCNFCDHRSTNEKEFKIHNDTRHMTVKVKVKQNEVPGLKKQTITFDCSQCDYTCALRIQLQKHSSSKHEWQKCEPSTEAFPCEFCSQVFANFPLLQEHVNELHTATLFECQYCVFTSENKSTVEKHDKEEHAERIRCQVCDEIC